MLNVQSAICSEQFAEKKSVLRVKMLWARQCNPLKQLCFPRQPCLSSCRLVQNTMQRPSCVSSSLLGPSVSPPPSNLITQTHFASTNQPTTKGSFFSLINQVVKFSLFPRPPCYKNKVGGLEEASKNRVQINSVPNMAADNSLPPLQMWSFKSFQIRCIITQVPAQPYYLNMVNHQKACHEQQY